MAGRAARRLDALRWDDVDFTPGAESIRIERQWNVNARAITRPKHDSRRTIAMVEPLRERLLTLPRESEWVFTTLRGTHYTPSARTFHWNRVRCTIGLGDVSLYLATRHLYGWYALNVLDLPRTSSRCNQGTTTAGGSCESSYGTRRGDRAPAHARRVPRSRARDGAPERRETRPRAKRGVERNRVYLPRSAADRREQPDACGAH